jgi:hypothetical protein
MMRWPRFALSVAAVVVGFVACAGGSSADGSTSWLSSCTKDAECQRGLSCICGVCTKPCAASSACSTLDVDAVCAPARDAFASCSSDGDTNVCIRRSTNISAPDATTGTPGAVVHDGGLDGAAGKTSTGSSGADAAAAPQEDAAVDDGGCDGNCRGDACNNDLDCTDGTFCNGMERCVAGPSGKTCIGGAPIADGTACGESDICRGGICRPSVCGDGYTAVAFGESCDPPNTPNCDSTCHAITTCNLSGNWAMKLTTTVSFSGAGLVDGQGEIDEWALLTITQQSSAFNATLEPCGITLPDFHTTPSFGDETHGITIAASAFDSGTIPTSFITALLSDTAPGATFGATTWTSLIGLDIGPPASASGQWPANSTQLTPQNGYTLTDVDADGQPGVTAMVKTGPIPGSATNYADIIWDLGNPALQNPRRTKELQLAIRLMEGIHGTVDSCSQLSGPANVTVDDHVVGCVPEDASATCSATLVDYIRPIYTTTSAAFVAHSIGAESTCSAVRTAMP